MAHLAHRCSSARPHDVRPLLLMMLIRPADLMHAPPARQCSSAGRLMALRLAGSAAHAPARRPPRCRILPARRCSSMPAMWPTDAHPPALMLIRRPADGPPAGCWPFRPARPPMPAHRGSHHPPADGPLMLMMRIRPPARSIRPPADAHRSTHPMRSIPAC